MFKKCVIITHMKYRILFTGGGTGGHIYPGLAVCDELRKLAKQNNVDLEIYWFGNSKGMDKDIVLKSKSVEHFCGIPSGKLRRYFSIQNFFDIFKIFAGFIVSFFKILFIKPKIVFSKGGFVSVPPCIAAKILHIPIFTHECDFTPGLATKINSRFADKILISYEKTKEYFPENKQKKIIFTGNPVRPCFYEANPKKGIEFIFGKSDFELKKPILFVSGGSLGAHQINSLVVENLDWLTQRFYVVHQCGKADENFVPKNVQDYFSFPFIYENMCDVLSCAAIVLSRAGANSLWENSACGKPMILIPLCGNGTRGDQLDNAEYFEKSGAALTLVGEKADSNNLKKSLEFLLQNENYKEMAEKSNKISSGKKPSLKIAEEIFNFLSLK